MTDRSVSRTDVLRASPPMFDSKVLDALSRVHPAIPVIIFLPAIVVLAAWALSGTSALVAVALAVAGYAPALEECSRCGASGEAKRLTAFAVAAGGMVCADCRPPGAASPAPQTVALMLALLRGDWDGAMRSERRHRVECSGLVAAYLQWHLEHSIRSLRHVERA